MASSRTSCLTRLKCTAGTLSWDWLSSERFPDGQSNGGQSAPGQDRSEWQIEWQTELARAYPEFVTAGPCSCSGRSGALPATT